MSIFILEKIILPPKKSQFPAKNRVSPTMFTDPPPRYEDPQAQQYCLHHASKHSHQLKRENIFHSQNKKSSFPSHQLKTENISQSQKKNKKKTQNRKYSTFFFTALKEEIFDSVIQKFTVAAKKIKNTEHQYKIDALA